MGEEEKEKPYSSELVLREDELKTVIGFEYTSGSKCLNILVRANTKEEALYMFDNVAKKWEEKIRGWMNA